MSKETKCDNLQKDERVRAIIGWVLAGYFTKDIIKQAMVSWPDIETERTVYNYLKDARKELRSVRLKEMKDIVAFHQAARLKLYNGVENKKTHTGASVALSILQDMARIDDVYPSKSNKIEIDGDTIVIVGAKQVAKE